jgi:opacity protein-like surface antigen
MRLLSLPFVVCLCGAAALTTASADLQIGLGTGAYVGNEYDEHAGWGFEGEIGYLNQDQPINLFVGARALYIDGLEAKYANVFSSDQSDLDLFEGAFVTRLIFPTGLLGLKFYGEGSIGTGNLTVSGKTKAHASVGNQDFSVRSHFDDDDWVLAWGLGAGLQYDFGRNFGIRLGYNFHGFGDVRVDNVDRDPGVVHGLTSSLIFKF